MPLPDNTLWHLCHSAFALKLGGVLMIFDYFLPETERKGRGLADGFIAPAEIAGENVYVLNSHEHGDHYHPVIFSWRQQVPGIRYILSSDIQGPHGSGDAVRMGPHQEATVGDLRVETYPSSDCGVAFAVFVAGKHIYFAGDNGFWNWNLNMSEDDDYYKEDLSPLDTSQSWDIAFALCDPRLEDKGEGGIYAVARLLKPKLLVPIHSFGKYEINRKAAAKLKEMGFAGRYWCVGKRGEVYQSEV